MIYIYFSLDESRSDEEELQWQVVYDSIGVFDQCELNGDNYELRSLVLGEIVACNSSMFRAYYQAP
jgi:hypothetical protein